MRFHLIILLGLYMGKVLGSPSVSFITRQKNANGTTTVVKRSVTDEGHDRMVFLESQEVVGRSSGGESEDVSNESSRIVTTPSRRTRPRRPPSAGYQEATMQIYRDENDKIYFPEETKFNPSAPRISRPDCAKDSVFCTEDKNYPKSHIESLLEQNLQEYVEFKTEDYFTADLTQRNDIPGEESLCESYESKVYPTTGVNRDNKWLYIINQSNVTQGVRIEECRRKGQPCSLATLFPPTYVSECKQKYQYRQLLALDENGKIIKDFFMLPSCCKCYVRQN